MQGPKTWKEKPYLFVGRKNADIFGEGDELSSLKLVYIHDCNMVYIFLTRIPDNLDKLVCPFLIKQGVCKLKLNAT